MSYTPRHAALEKVFNGQLDLEDPIPAGDSIVAIAAFDTLGAARVVGTVQADQPLQLWVYQGGSNDANMHTKTGPDPFVIPAGLDEGDGDGFSAEVASRRAKIVIKNTGASACEVVRMEVNLRSMS